MKTLLVLLLVATLAGPGIGGKTAQASGYAGALRSLPLPSPATHKIAALTVTGKSGNPPAGSPATLDAGARDIRWSFDYTNLAPDDEVSWRLYLGARQLLFDSIYRASELIHNTKPKSGTVKVQTPLPGGFAPGFYRLEMKVNDQIEQTGDFTVLPKGKTPTFANVVFAAEVIAPGAELRELPAVKYDFDPGAGQMFAVFDHFNLDQAKSWGWRLSREGAKWDERLNQSWSGDPQGTFALPMAAPDRAGVYDLDLFLNGKWATAGSFAIGRPEPDPARVLQTDDFSDPKSGWTIQKTGANSADYVNGQIVADLGADMQSWSSMSGKRFGDGITEIEVTPQLDEIGLILQVADGFAHYGWYGMVARFQDSNNFYIFAIQPTGKYAILLAKGSSVRTIRDWTQVVQDVYSFGTVKAVRLRVLAQGPMLRFYINDRLVDVVPDAQWKDGLAGAVAATDKDYALKVAFDNWRLSSLSNAPDRTAGAAPQAASGQGQTGAPGRGAPAESAGAVIERGTPGVRLDVASWAPKPDAAYGGWGVVPTGAAPDKNMKLASKVDEALAVPPGAYDVYWVQDYDHGKSPILLASNVAVTDQGTVVLKVNSGLQLDVAAQIPTLDASYGWWGAVKAGDKPDQRVNWTNVAPGALVLPAGRYDVYWVQDYDHGKSPILLASDVAVADQGAVVLKVNSGLQLGVAAWAPKLDASYGWWGAVKAGDKPDQRVNWTNATPGALVLPPGQYDVYWVQDYDHGKSPILMAGNVAVTAEGLASLKVDSGLQLDVATWAPKLDASYGWWGAVKAGDEPEQRVNWTNTTPGALVLPPGQYDVYWVQDYDHGKSPLLWASSVDVEEGQVPSVAATSGLRLILPTWTPALDKNYGWWGVAPAGETAADRVAWWTGEADAPLLVPPGQYDLYWKQDYSQEPQLLHSDVAVEANELTELEVDPASLK